MLRPARAHGKGGAGGIARHPADRFRISGRSRAKSLFRGDSPHRGGGESVEGAIPLPPRGPSNLRRVEVSNLILAGIAAVAAVAGLWYQWRTRRQRQLEEIADLLAELHNVVVGQVAAIGQPMAKARLRTRLGRRRDLPKTREVLDTPLSFYHDEHVNLVEAAQAEVDAKLHG